MSIFYKNVLFGIILRHESRPGASFKASDDVNDPDGGPERRGVSGARRQGRQMVVVERLAVERRHVDEACFAGGNGLGEVVDRFVEHAAVHIHIGDFDTEAREGVGGEIGDIHALARRAECLFKARHGDGIGRGGGDGVVNACGRRLVRGGRGAPVRGRLGEGCARDEGAKNRRQQDKAGYSHSSTKGRGAPTRRAPSRPDGRVSTLLTGRRYQ